MTSLADALHRVAERAGTLRALERDIAAERDALTGDLSTARELGATLTQLGDAAGLSRQRVAQLLADRPGA